MHKKNAFIRIIPAIAVLLFGITSCHKSNYLTDTGVHNPVTPLNNCDYLAQNQFKQFDTLLQIIDRFDGLRAEVNKAGTFFAPTDYSIVRAINNRLALRQQINPVATYTLDTLIKYMTVDSLRQYLFKETITLDNTPELQAKPYTSLGSTTQGAIKTLQAASPYTDRTSAPTYLLFFVKVRGALDIPGVTPPTNETDISIVCQTTGIRTSNGSTTLHVLSNNHVFITF